MPATPQLALLALLFAFAFTVESALGFGSTVLVVALGSLRFPIERLLTTLLPLNLLLSLALVLRGRGAVALPLLLRRVLPAMALGLPFGLWALRRLPEARLKLVFALFVLALSALELTAPLRERRAQAQPPRPLGPAPSWLLLALGGALHGAFGTGGPLAVYVLGRSLSEDKARFRATLSALWLALNTALLAAWLYARQLTAASLTLTAALAPALLLGLVLGDAAHHRLPQRLFRPLVFALLAVAASLLLLRSLWPAAM